MNLTCELKLVIVSQKACADYFKHTVLNYNLIIIHSPVLPWTYKCMNLKMISFDDDNDDAD